ncbi:MAG: NUDIX hydrolase [Lactobacillaceae bacterium]|jgi:8-oxo-dGTP diphosphatase|nr:NUDIX hydrolase [Lactobacillaceae bacterium]
MEMNLELVFNENLKNILFVKRVKEPFKGLFNLVGGKKEPGESSIDGAYRELFEETGITKENIKLVKLMAFEYPLEDIHMDVYFGRLNKKVTLIEEKNPLSWHSIEDTDFLGNEFAGDGNIYHMVKEAQYYLDRLM